MAKEAYYFSHDSNARHDDKILELRSEMGWEGYGIYWAVVETLRDCSNYTYPSNAKAGLALSLNIDKPKLEQFLKHCINLGLFVEKDGAIYSESLMKRMEEIDEKRRKRAEAGRLGGKAKAKQKQKSGNAKAKPSKESKEKESKEEEINYPFKGVLFLQKWQSWKDYKKAQFKFTFKSEVSEQAQLTHLKNLSGNDESKAIQIIDYTMGQTYQGFVEPKKYRQETATAKPEPFVYADLYGGKNPNYPN